jgi:hypothetical protein
MRVHAFLFTVGMLASVAAAAQSHLRLKDGKDVPDDERRHLPKSDKVEICHIPPGNPENFKTIIVGAKAAAAHLDKGSLSGQCTEDCRTASDCNPARRVLCGDVTCDPVRGCVGGVNRRC